jgi:hypothetical protein
MPGPPYGIAGQSKTMAAEQLSFEQLKMILKWYWKFENVSEVRREWCREFSVEFPTRLKIVKNLKPILLCTSKDLGGLGTATNPASTAMLLEQFI